MSAHDEGHTVAGWTGTAIATVGSCVLGLGICTTSALAVTGGTAVLVVALLVTWALHLAGWGKPPGVRPVGEWRMRERDRSARAGHPGCVGCRLAGRGRGRERERGRRAGGASDGTAIDSYSSGSSGSSHSSGSSDSAGAVEVAPDRV